jgi:hypothetical protein
MRADKSNEYPLFLKIELCHQPVGIALDVENNPAIL